MLFVDVGTPDNIIPLGCEGVNPKLVNNVSFNIIVLDVVPIELSISIVYFNASPNSAIPFMVATVPPKSSTFFIIGKIGSSLTPKSKLNTFSFVIVNIASLVVASKSESFVSSVP